MNAELASLPDVKFRLDPGGWLTACQRVPDLDQMPPHQLLAPEMGALAGNLRYARTEAGVVRLGDLRISDDPPAVEHAEARLRRWLAGEPIAPGLPAVEEQIETALAESGCPWTRRDSVWVLPASTVRAVEMVIRPVPGGARVEATLADLDGVGMAERTALAEFLCRAQSGLRFARCVMDSASARVVSLADTEHFDSDMQDSLGSILAACRLLTRETRALLKPDVAREYLELIREARG